MSLWKKKCSASLGLGEMRTETLQGCHGSQVTVVMKKMRMWGREGRLHGRNVTWCIPMEISVEDSPKLTTVHCGRGRSLRQSEKHSSPVV